MSNGDEEDLEEEEPTFIIPSKVEAGREEEEEEELLKKAREKLLAAGLSEEAVEPIIELIREIIRRGKLPSLPSPPYLRAGAEPVTDTERLRFRPYRPNIDQILAILAARQYDTAAADRIINTEGVVRWLEVGLPEQALEELERAGRRFRYERTEKPDDEREVYAPPGFRNDKDYTELVGAAAPEPAQVGEENQHHWVLDIFPPQAATREFTGFLHKPKESVGIGLVEHLQYKKGQEKSLWEILDERDPTAQEVFDIRALAGQASMEVTSRYFDYSQVVATFEDEFLPKAQEAVDNGEVETIEEYAPHFYLPFFTSELYAFWREFEKRYRYRKTGKKVRSQSVPEAIHAKEWAADLISCVLKPLLTSWDKAKKRLEVLWGTQDTRIENGDGIHNLRKIIDLIKDWLGKRRAKAHQIFNPADVKGSGDRWFAGLWDPFERKHLLIPLPGASDQQKQRIYRALYGWLMDLPDDFLLPSGPEAGVWHQNLHEWMISSFKTLTELSDQARGATITYKKLKEIWEPKLADFTGDEVIFGWWDRREKRLYAAFDPEHPDRKLRIALRDDFLTLLDWNWVMTAWIPDNCYYWQIPAYVNLRFRKNHLVGVEVTGQGVAEPNYLRHLGIAWEIWRCQPAQPLDQQLEEEVGEAELNHITNTLDLVVKRAHGMPDIRHGRPDMEAVVTKHRKRATYWMFRRMAEKYWIGAARAYKVLGAWMDETGYPDRIGDPAESDQLTLQSGFWQWACGAFDDLHGRGETSDDFGFTTGENDQFRRKEVMGRRLNYTILYDKKPPDDKRTAEVRRHEIGIWLQRWAGFPTVTWRDSIGREGATARMAERIRKDPPDPWAAIEADLVAMGKTEFQIMAVRAVYKTFHNHLLDNV